MNKVVSIFRMLHFITNHPLNRNRKLESVRRLLSWQLGSRLAPGPIVVDFVNDAKLLVRPGMTGATGNIYTGLHEFEDMSFVLHVLRKGDLFVDVGANVGTYTILAGAAIGARCLAFEPIPSTYRHLLQNINLNGIGENASPRNIGIGSESGFLDFSTEFDTVNHVVPASEKGSFDISVPVKTLDDALAGEQPTVIKIDVEGFETSIIQGAANVLRQASLLAIVMELNGSGKRYGFDENQLHSKMLQEGFQPFAYAPFERKLLSLVGKNIISSNTIYIKNVEKVQMRVTNAPPFVVYGESV